MENIPNTMPPAQAPKKSLGSIIAIIVIIVLVVLGGLYFWGKQLMTSTPSENSSLPAVSSSDEVQSIAKDVDVDLNGDVNVDVSDLEATLK